MDLTIEKRVQADLSAERDKAKKEAEEEMKLKVMEKDQTITAMQKQIEDLKRRAEQGSQQLQGEVQELELEALLTANFRATRSSPCPKANSAATCCSASSAAQPNVRHDSLGIASAQKTGATAGCPSCAKTNARPKPKSPLSSAKRCRKMLKRSASSTAFGSPIRKSRCPSRSPYANR